MIAAAAALPTLPLTDPVLIVAVAMAVFLLVPLLAEPGIIGLIVRVARRWSHHHTGEIAMVNEPQPGCPRCGGDRLAWRIKRNRAAVRDSHRTLLWTCGGCGAEWSEPLSVTIEHLPDAQFTG